MIRERTKTPQLPDAINCSISKDFTQIPNHLLRNPEITGKAKALLCLLLSNKHGWTSHMDKLQVMMKEGRDSILSALRELEEIGYLKRIKYKDKEKKRWSGSFWAYTDIPGEFNLSSQVRSLEAQGYLISEPETRNPETGSQFLGIYNNCIKNTKNKNIADLDRRSVPPTLEQVERYCKERNNTVDPDQWFNFYASKGWMIGKNKMKDWQAAIRTWERNREQSAIQSKPPRYWDGMRYDYDPKRGNWFHCTSGEKWVD